MMSDETSDNNNINNKKNIDGDDDDSAAAAAAAAFRYMKSILGERVRCTISEEDTAGAAGGGGVHDGDSSGGRQQRQQRVVVGQFICMDRLMNLILTNAVEEREINIDDYKVNNISYNSSDSNSNEDTNNTRNTMTVYRRLTQAMIPGSKIVKFEIDQKIHDDRTKTVAAAAAAV